MNEPIVSNPPKFFGHFQWDLPVIMNGITRSLSVGLSTGIGINGFLDFALKFEQSQVALIELVKPIYFCWCHSIYPFFISARNWTHKRSIHYYYFSAAQRLRSTTASSGAARPAAYQPLMQNVNFIHISEC